MEFRTNLSFLLLSLACLSGLCSCSQSGPQASEIRISASEIIFDGSPSQGFSFTVGSGAAWSIDAAALPWVTVRPSEGDGVVDVTVLVTAQDNPDEDCRSGFLIISGGGVSKQIKVFQRPSFANGEIAIQSPSLSFPSYTTDTTFVKVYSDSSWQLVSRPDEWTLAAPSYGYGHKVTVLALIPSPNTGDARTMELGIAPSKGGTFLFTANQEGGYPKPVTPEEYCATVDGYRGIWFSIGQAASEYGPKYSGGLGTYTMKHIPMAVYSPVVDRTYFVYGGAPSEGQAYLQCMIGCYDHRTGCLQKPRVVYDKGALGVSDPHDDPTVQIDRDGYIWVFVAGRANKRPGLRFKSVNPYNIEAFDYVSESIMAYPQVMYSKDKGFFLFETRYDGTRQLFFQKSPDGVEWTQYRQLASIKEGSEKNSGHYQISNICGTKLCTAFNRHINGDVDTRTNFYYLQSTDWGETWTTASGENVDIPVVDRWSNCLVHDYQTEGRNCYIKDLNFDSKGNPVVIMLTSDNHLTGPDGGVREWHVWNWDGGKWNDTLLTTSTHCYDSGSIWTDGSEWTIIAPTANGPQLWGAGGEVVMWKSFDEGKSWNQVRQLTSGSERNHTYMRRPLNASEGFYCFWADGNPDAKSISYLYFCNSDGEVFRMPYNMTEEWARPEKLSVSLPL